jgi:ketosteroid isomerase-like protein
MPTETSRSKKSELVGRLYATFIAGDRPAMETLLADEVTFTSPCDEHIDNAESVMRWCHRRAKMRDFELETVCVEGDAAFVRYRATRTNDGVTFRNVEYVVCAGERIKSVEVYFGAEEKSA